MNIQDRIAARMGQKVDGQERLKPDASRLIRFARINRGVVDALFDAIEPILESGTSILFVGVGKTGRRLAYAMSYKFTDPLGEKYTAAAIEVRKKSTLKRHDDSVTMGSVLNGTRFNPTIRLEELNDALSDLDPDGKPLKVIVLDELIVSRKYDCCH